MAKLLITFSFLLALTIVASNPTKLLGNIKIKIVTPDEMQNLLKKYPNAFEVEPSSHEARKIGDKSSYKLTYTFGKRISGDFLVANDTKSYSFETPQDVQTTLSYPVCDVDEISGDDETTLSYPPCDIGHIVTYLSFVVRQSTLNARMYILSGGIGQGHFEIFYETHKTYIFDQDAKFYGK